MSSKKLDDTREITAQPRPILEELVSAPVTEAGLSIDPEDLGRQFLSDATEQSNFESSRGGDSSEVNITESALTDQSLSGAAWATGDVWEQTVNMSLQSGGLDETRGKDPLEGLPEEDEKQAEVERELGQDMHDVDMTSSSIHNASLMDYETDELGGVASPSVRTDARADFEMRRASATEELESTLPTGQLHPGRRRRTASVG